VAEHRSILKNKRVVRILVIFEDRPMFSHIIQKVSARASIDVAEHRSILENKGVVRVLIIFKIDLCSAISFKRSRRELSIDVAEHTSVLKNRNLVLPKTGKTSLKWAFVFPLNKPAPTKHSRKSKKIRINL